MDEKKAYFQTLNATYLPPVYLIGISAINRLFCKLYYTFMAIIIQNFMLLDTEVIEKALSSQNRVQNTYLFIRAARTPTANNNMA